MSNESYMGVPYVNQLAPTFKKEDFLGSSLGTNNGHANSKVLDLPVPGSVAEGLMVVVDNVVQEPTADYTIHETANAQPKILKFASAPSGSASIYVIHRGYATVNQTPPTGSVTDTALAANLKSFTTDSFTGDASTTAFTLSETPPNANSILVSVNGSVQKATTDFSLSSATLTFTSAPASAAVILVKHLGVRGVLRRGPDYQLDTFNGDGSTTAFTLSNSISTNNAFVYYNGTCMQPTDDYAISGTTLTFTFAPLNNSDIMVRYQL